MIVRAVRLFLELPAVDHGDRYNDDPQRGGQYEVIGHEGNPPRRRREDKERAGCETRVHEHRHEQAPGTVVDPHHEHPVGWQYGYIEEEWGQEEGQGERSGGIAASPVGWKEVPHSPQKAHDEPGGKDTITPP